MRGISDYPVSAQQERYDETRCDIARRVATESALDFSTFFDVHKPNSTRRNVNYLDLLLWRNCLIGCSISQEGVGSMWSLCVTRSETPLLPPRLLILASTPQFELESTEEDPITYKEACKRSLLHPLPLRRIVLAQPITSDFPALNGSISVTNDRLESMNRTISSSRCVLVRRLGELESALQDGRSGLRLVVVGSSDT